MIFAALACVPFCYLQTGSEARTSASNFIFELDDITVPDVSVAGRKVAATRRAGVTTDAVEPVDLADTDAVEPVDPADVDAVTPVDPADANAVTPVDPADADAVAPVGSLDAVQPARDPGSPDVDTGVIAGWSAPTLSTKTCKFVFWLPILQDSSGCCLQFEAEPGHISTQLIAFGKGRQVSVSLNKR